MSKMGKFGVVIMLNCALLMMVGTMMGMAPKSMSTEEFFNISGTFFTTLFLIWNIFVIKLLAVNEG